MSSDDYDSGEEMDDEEVVDDVADDGSDVDFDRAASALFQVPKSEVDALEPEPPKRKPE